MFNILFVIFRRHVLILSCVFIMMSRVLWILWILSQVVLVFLSCCLKKNLQEWIVDFCYVFQKQKIFIFAVLFRCPGLFVFIVCWIDDVNFLSKYEFHTTRSHWNQRDKFDHWILSFDFWIKLFCRIGIEYSCHLSTCTVSSARCPLLPMSCVASSLWFAFPRSFNMLRIIVFHSMYPIR